MYQTQAGGGGRESGEGLVVEEQPVAVGDGFDSAGRWSRRWRGVTKDPMVPATSRSRPIVALGRGMNMRAGREFRG